MFDTTQGLSYKLRLMKFPHKSNMLVVLVLLLVMATGVMGQRVSFPAYTGHVNDFANVIDAQTRQTLENILTNFEQRTGTQIAAVTVQSLEDRPVEEYANELYRAWGIGAKGGENKDKGALLLVALGDRKTRLEVGYGLEGDLPDGLAGELIRRMRPFLQRGDHSKAMYVGVRSIVDTLAERWNISLEGIEDRQFAYRQSRAGKESNPVPIFIVFIILIIVLSIISRLFGGRGGGGGGGRSSDLWWLAPIIFNRSGGSFGGGSWGSGGGGGGGGSGGGGSDWGGFGGGSSGGGGASDSW